MATRNGPAVLLFRHGETEWSRDGRHTGRTDVPLTDAGRRHAEALGARLAGHEFALVLTSPLQRARVTAAIVGLGDRAEVLEELREYDYGSYEGRRTVASATSVLDGTSGATERPTGSRTRRPAPAPTA